MRVLADRHHAGLYRSLQLLGDRLGWELYTPLGREWADEGYWQFGLAAYGDDRLVEQYLVPHGDDWVPTEATALTDHWLSTYDSEFPDVRIDGMTLAQARARQWDYIMATVQDNQFGFHRFAQEVGAQFVMQVGNTGQYIDWGLDPIVLSSSEMPILGRGVQYHQEMDSIASTYRDPTKAQVGRISSFVNCFPSIMCAPVWEEARALRPDLTWKQYGIDGADGVLKPISKIADEMARAQFIWHDKAHGDGFGHVIHMAAAIGRPLIGHASHYAGKMGEVFWTDGVTCVDLDRHSVREALDIVEMIMADPYRHDAMCNAIRRVYERIDYDAEAEAIRSLLAASRKPVAA